MSTIIQFKDIKIGTMFYWSGIYIVKTKEDFGEYKPGHEFYFFAHETMLIDEHCKIYNEENKNETRK